MASHQTLCIAKKNGNIILCMHDYSPHNVILLWCWYLKLSTSASTLDTALIITLPYIVTTRKIMLLNPFLNHVVKLVNISYAMCGIKI